MFKYFVGILLCALLVSAKRRHGRSPAQEMLSSLMKRSTKGGAAGTGSIAIADGNKVCAAAFLGAANSYEIDPIEALKTYYVSRREVFRPPSCGLKVATCDAKTLYRTFDGSCNNLENPTWGVPNSTYHRILPPRYADGLSHPRMALNGSMLPSCRQIRTTLFPTGSRLNNELNINAMTFGQFIAHDLSLLKTPDHDFECCTCDGQYETNKGRFCFPIKVPDDDPTMGLTNIRCMNFTRTFTDKDMGGCKDDVPASQINTVTDYLDLSNVYGLNDKICKSLRSLKGGKLKTEVRDNHIFPPNEKNKLGHCRFSLAHENVCYKTGDSRANQNPHLAILQILFLREHNRIATELKALNPRWSDEKLFQETRRILIAAYQQIVYYEWLPIFIGKQNMLDKRINYNTTGHHNDYDPKQTPGITNEYAHAAFRYFHTNIVGLCNHLNSKREKINTFRLSDWLNRPQILENNVTHIDQLTLGMIGQNLEEFDGTFVEEITDKLFAGGKQYGIDLRATDFQRDRDHALGYYFEYRKPFGLKEIKSFDDFGDFISPRNIDTLKKMYANYTDVDLSVAGSIEKHVQDAEVGPTFQGILNEQFLRTRQADRFFFEHKEAGFTIEQLAEIKKQTVSRMFCDNGDGIKDMQPNGFALVSEKNPIKPCSEIPKMDLSPWKEQCHCHTKDT